MDKKLEKYDFFYLSKMNSKNNLVLVIFGLHIIFEIFSKNKIDQFLASVLLVNFFKSHLWSINMKPRLTDEMWIFTTA